jgi:ADP-ribose pyrophosphatase YjhB (NUDIX family)
VPAARFCSTCGGLLANTPPTRCAACGTDHWLNPKPCANAIVVDDGKVLLVRRAHGPWQGAWCAPGGFCEVGEHPILTAERETFEETGIRAEVTGFIGLWIDAYADRPAPEGAETINVGYYHAIPVGTEGGVDPQEVSEVAWFGWDELPSELAPPGTLVAVLAAARVAHARGTTAGDLPDRPA